MIPPPDKFSDYTAVLALIISAISLTISWRSFIRDRSHLKLSLDFAHRPNQGSQYQVTITNDGRRTATLVKVDALLWFRKRQTIFQQETILTEGKPKVVYAPLAMIPSISSPLAVRAFEAEDSVGDKYHASTIRLFLKIVTTKK